jgi:hypothetical protein
MNGHNRVARTLIVLGSIVLFVSAALHSFAAHAMAFPALTASNLNPGMQAAFRVIFLAAGWHWLVIAIAVLIGSARQIKSLVLLCGLAVLVEAIGGAVMMGLFIGNEMIGTAAILITCGGVLLGSTLKNEQASGRV